MGNRQQDRDTVHRSYPEDRFTHVGLDDLDLGAEDDHDGENDTGDLSAPTRDRARGWLMTEREFVRLFSPERGRFADVRLKEARHRTPSLFHGGPSGIR
jgi:hypothetical protein